MTASALELEKRIAELEEENLDLRDEVERLEDQGQILENFVFGLEKEHDEARKLLERTQGELRASHDRLAELSRQQDEILRSMEEGVITIDADGRVGAQHSHSALGILGTASLAGRRLGDVLGGELGRRLDDFVDIALGATHATRRMLASMNPLDGAELTVDGAERRISANVVRFVSEETQEPKLLIALRDRTDEHRLEEALAAQTRVQRARIERAYQLLLTPPELQMQLQRDGETLCGVLREVPMDVDQCSRRAHALKGDARALGIDALAETVHDVEDAIAEGAQPLVLQTLADRLEMELDEDRSLLERFAEVRERARSDAGDQLSALVKSCADREADSLGIVVRTQVFSTVDEPVHGPLLEQLRSPIVALVRNAVAHGGQSPEVRRTAGKEAALQLEVYVEPRDLDLVVRVRDDGQGIDFEAARARARALGMVGDEPMTRAELAELLFVPHLTTRETSTMSAGRGMGMDIVRDAVVALGGAVELESEPGHFTECRFHLPLERLCPSSSPERRP